MGRLRPSSLVALSALACSAWAGGPARGADRAESSPRARARAILAKTGVRGGLIVHLGCGDGALTAALRAGAGWIVQGLDRDPDKVRRARGRIRSLGLYGKVSVDRWAGGRLPYIDNLANLVVSERPTDISMEEILRVLAPGGVAYVKAAEGWRKTVKPRPEAIDEWTHYLHDASGNAVAHDAVVGPPRHLQWVGGPRWSRHHEHMSSVSGLVSAGGRIFTIFDEGADLSIYLPSKWALIARDAFNGTVLWKRRIPSWFTRLWPLKSGPAQLPRRLVAAGDRVYVTLGLDAPLSALDAATGETVRTYEGTRATEEVIASEGVLFLLVDPSPAKGEPYKAIHTVCWDETNRVARERPWDGRKRRIAAIRAATGEVLWRGEHVVVPLTLAADRARVYFHDGERVIALDRGTGGTVWRSEPVAARSPMPVSFAPTLVVSEDVVLFSGGKRSQTALSAETGETLWTSPHPRTGHHSPEDVLVIDGLVWSGAVAGGRDSGVFTGRDLHTGAVEVRFRPDVKTYWFHHRCYRAKATDRYILPSRTGTEFVDFRGKHWIPHHWVRGACVYGVMPCNGLLYAPPSPCACYMETKLNAFCALAPASASRRLPRGVRDADRLERGPAYGARPAASAGPGDWPTYRHDPARSGSTGTPVAAPLERAWRTRPGGRLSSPVIAGGRLFVASVDTHTVYALDAASGGRLWSATAGGRVDSPPTIHRGRVLFGSADGWVYCLRASDGALIWRFRAAPAERRLVAHDQVESVWPVHGSVLVARGAVYCVAGRSMFTDGGMRLLRLDPETGRKLSETILDDRDPESGANLQAKVHRLDMPTARPDILSSDGRYVYMRSQRFDLDGARGEVVTPTDPSDQAGDGVHLYAPAGFLDDAWFHRTYWLYGKTFISGCNWWFRAGRFAPAGRILVFDDANVYGFGRRPQLHCWTSELEYHLFAAPKRMESESLRRVARANGEIESSHRSAIFDRKVTSGVPLSQVSAVPYGWSHGLPILARAMVLARGTLFVAGPPDLVDEFEAFEDPFDPAIRAKLAEQDAALRGAKGGTLIAVSASDGKRLAAYPLDDVPVFDGMAAGGGRLYLATRGGEILCFAGRGPRDRAGRTRGGPAGDAPASSLRAASDRAPPGPPGS